MKDVQQKFGRAVRVARTQKGWSQEQLGHATGLDRTYISGIERGVRNPTLTVIVKLGAALGVLPGALLSGPDAS